MRALRAAVLFSVALGFAGRASAAPCPPLQPNCETTITLPAETTSPAPATTAPPATAPQTTRTTVKSTTTQGPTTTKSPVTLPPVAPQPTVTTFSDVTDSGPNGVIPAAFPILSGLGFLSVIGILVGGWFRRR